MDTSVNVVMAGSVVGRGGKYLTFALGREEYGLEILSVREIIGMIEITSIPRLPGYVRGVVNLRGQVVAVVDLRAKFGMEAVKATEQTCIIMVEIGRAGRKVAMGIMVDRVLEVLNIAEGDIEDAPEMGAAIASDFILGMGKVGGNVKILLDISKVLEGREVEQLQRIN